MMMRTRILFFALALLLTSTASFGAEKVTEKQLKRIPVLELDVGQYDIRYSRRYVRKCFDDVCLGVRRDEYFGESVELTYKLSKDKNLSFGVQSRKQAFGERATATMVTYRLTF